MSEDEFEKALRDRYPLISALDQMLWRAYELDPDGLDRRKERAKPRLSSISAQLGQQQRS